MLQEKILIRLLAESKMDSLANAVSRRVLQGIKDRMREINSSSPRREGKFIVRTVDWEDAVPGGDKESDVEVRVALAVMATKEDKTPVEASWDWADETLNVHVYVQSTTGKIRPDHLSMVQKRLYDATRHELEHSTQSDAEAAGAIGAHAAWSADPEDLDKRVAYYTDPAEVKAFASGIYNRAKKLRVPFHKAAEEDLDKIRRAMLRVQGADVDAVEAAVDKIKAAWTAEAARRFPRAALQAQG